MHLAFPRRLLLLGSLMLAGACNGADTTTSDANAPTPHAANALRFDVNGVLTVGVGERVSVGLTVPPEARNVAVWLDGVYGDASLDATDVVAHEGRASFTLRAPTGPAYFTLRASVAGESAELGVSASAAGFADVRVAPSYAGRRPTPLFVGSVFVGTSCADLPKMPIKDGAGVVKEAPGVPLLLARVPASTRIAVATRIAHYASGCVDVDSLAPDTTRDVSLPLYDRPMALDATHLETVLTFDPSPGVRESWAAMLTSAQSKAAQAFSYGSAQAQAGALLNAMHDAIPQGPATPPAYNTQFTAARSLNGWDDKTAAWLSAHSPLPFDRAVAWMTAGREAVFGDIVVRLDPLEQAASAGLTAFTLQKFGQLDATLGGFGTWEFGWTADPDDSVRLAGTMHFRPTMLITLTADAQARAAVPASRDVPSALAMASQLDCAGLATALVGGGSSYAGCNASCTASLCASGLAGAWRAASSAADEVQFGIAASGQAQVGEDAEPTSFNGAWLGQVGASAGSTAFAVSGRASAIYSNPPPK
jgi:hypothetical protein